MGTDRAWIPFLLFSGLLDVVFFASMMSFMGMAMSPQESSMAGDSGGATDSASDSDKTAGQEDSGAADSSSAAEAETSKGRV